MQQPPGAESATDNELLERIQAGDDEALSLIYDRYGGLTFALAFRLLGDRGQAEDVVQEAFLSLWRRAATFDAGRGSVRGWLTTITRNAAIDRRRGRFRHQQQERDIDDYAYRLAGGSEDVWQTVKQSLEGEEIHRALRELPDEQRRALELAYFDGLTQAEIAERLEIPLGTVKSRARLGLQRLASILEPSHHLDERNQRE